jgi:hypothetical protein
VRLDLLADTLRLLYLDERILVGRRSPRPRRALQVEREQARR